ncbi:trypsin-like serine protease [Streptomyces sp. NBC_00212]|uniref:trypsin-like serine protease n=1 Tax=Streptomyces sp. NBC_00212 TaxID=2975684 RepID=UPI003250C22B
MAAIGVGLVAPTPAEAIVSGVAAASGDAPYAVSLQTTSHFCGGTLLSPGTVLSTAGWGATSQGGSLPAALRRVDVPVADRGTCRTAYGASEEVTEHMLCAGLPQGGKDFSARDEGGPAVTHNLLGLPVLRALPSWHRGCAQAGYPGVYTRIGSYVPWITTHLAG